MMVASRANAPVGASKPAQVVSAEAAEVNAPASTIDASARLGCSDVKVNGSLGWSKTGSGSSR